MARLNVEVRARGEQRFSKLVDELGKSRAEVLGMLTIFWQDSQERGVWRGTKDDIVKFIDAPKADRQTWFDAFLEHEYVSPMEDGSDDFVIRGNRKHIEALDDLRDAAAEGGRAKARKINQNKEKLAEGRESLPAAENPLPNTIQFNSIQSSSTQCNSKQSNTEKQRFDFEAAYQRYPRKEGKSKGIKKLKAEVKTVEDFERLIVAIEKYAMSRRGQDQTFTKHFSTFVSEWRDWVDWEPSEAPPPQSQNTPAFRRMAGNAAALDLAIKAAGGSDA